MEKNRENCYEIAKQIYQLDKEVYECVGSSLGRTFTGDEATCVEEITRLLITRPQGHEIRSDIALIGNMARTIKNKEDHHRMMSQYNEILKKGEMIQYNRASQKIVRETFLANLYKCPSKSEGFYFSNLPLSDIVKELEYYFDTRIIILDQKLSDNTYIAYFTNGETLDEILSNLNTDGQMSITRSQEVIMITSATP